MNWRGIFSDREVNLGTEFISGVTSFLTSAYIIAVHPSILAQAGMDHEALIAVTCIAAGVSTLLMAIWPKVPVLMAPGMGLNAFFAFTVVTALGHSWREGLGFVFWAGVLFFLLSILGLRKSIAKAIPVNLRIAGSVGIGLFIAFLGFHNMEILKFDAQGFPHLAKLGSPQILGLMGLAVMGFLQARSMKGSLVIGIIVITLVSMFLGFSHWPESWWSVPPSIDPLVGQLQIVPSFGFATIVVVLTFMYIAMFDGLGTIVAVAETAGISAQPDSEKKISKMLAADSLSNILGALLGTSTVTAYIESVSGISQGGRTGWTAFFSALLFFAALFFVPFIAVIPSYATAPALIMVGVFMIREVTRIGLDSWDEALPAFLTMILMPLTTSIATGLMFGFISYTFLKVVTGKWQDLNPVLIGITVFSILNLVFGGRFL
jgi:AGZA family xanthine/uracil permease-like MFS transporter